MTVDDDDLRMLALDLAERIERAASQAVPLTDDQRAALWWLVFTRDLSALRHPDGCPICGATGDDSCESSNGRIRSDHGGRRR